MDKLKFALFSVVVLTLLGLFGYWAIFTLQSGSESKTSQKVQQLQKDNQDLNAEVKDLTDQLSVLQSKLDNSAPSAPKDSKPSVASPATVYKYQNLINDLQKLVDGNVYLKLKSIGPSVGTVQKFLNIYNNTSNKIDNDYGANMVKSVSAFQKDSGLSADGKAGSSTFSQMINWLKKQG